MESSFDKLDKKSGLPQLTAGCPFLGLKEDAETHFSTPSLGNYCHKVDPSEPVNLDHQDNFCLSDNHSNCLIFMNKWQGDLPDTIRGDGGQGSKSSKNKQVAAVAVLPVESDVLTPQPALEDIDQEPENPIENQKSPGKPNSINSVQPEGLPWTRLHDEARSRYLDTKPGNRDRYIWAGLIVIASIIFLASLWGLYNRFGELQTQAELSMLSARTLAAITADYQATVEMNATETARALFFIAEEDTPTPTIEPTTSTDDENASLTATANALTEAQDIVNCSDISGYSYEVVSGPDLDPNPGTIYISGSPEPTVQASWIIKNSGDCDWEQVVLKNTATNESVVPTLLREDVEIDLTDLNQVVKTGEEIQVVVRFKLNDAGTVNRDWLLLVNGFSLLDQPHFTLKVDNWVILQIVTATPTKSTVKKPTSPSNNATATPKPRVTPTPVKKTEPPPTREP